MRLKEAGMGNEPYNIFPLVGQMNNIRYMIEHEKPTEEQLKQMFMDLREMIDRTFQIGEWR